MQIKFRIMAATAGKELSDVYPGRDITNIVESSHYQKIGGWCRQGALNAAKCKGAQRWIKPFRCLEGPFQSDALLVPEGCLFDHIHNASRCWPFVRWNQTGAAACQDRNMQMRSFAMLLPCGISLFSGVEFVCCPKHFKGNTGVLQLAVLRAVEGTQFLWQPNQDVGRSDYHEVKIKPRRGHALTKHGTFIVRFITLL
uniref:E1 domain-containing protein n=1 Tax=Anopheles farauti TaxID=69004 RepID=A0A182Q397_9DIPT